MAYGVPPGTPGYEQSEADATEGMENLQYGYPVDEDHKIFPAGPGVGVVYEGNDKYVYYDLFGKNTPRLPDYKAPDNTADESDDKKDPIGMPGNNPVTSQSSSYHGVVPWVPGIKGILPTVGVIKTGKGVDVDSALAGLSNSWNFIAGIVNGLTNSAIAWGNLPNFAYEKVTNGRDLNWDLLVLYQAIQSSGLPPAMLGAYIGQCLTYVNVQLSSIAGISNTALAAGGLPLDPYGGPGGGHHVGAKAAFTGATGYSENAALALANDTMAQYGIRHGLVTGAQQTLYRQFAQTGQTLTWEVMAKIEAQALMAGGGRITASVASATVKQAINALKAAGVTGPTRIPWGF